MMTRNTLSYKFMIKFHIFYSNPNARLMRNIDATIMIPVKTMINFLPEILPANFTPNMTPGMEPISNSPTR